MYQESKPTLVVEGVNFIISTDSSDEISKDDLIEIAKSHEKNSTIIIHEVIYFEESIRNLHSVVSPLNWGVENRYETTLGSWGSEVLASDYFVTSVARGAEETYTTSFNFSLSAGYTGNPFLVSEVALSSSISASYEASYTFKGPSEDSPYSSMEYRIKFFEQSGDWTQKQYMYDHVVGIRTGTRTKPTRAIKYSQFVN